MPRLALAVALLSITATPLPGQDQQLRWVTLPSGVSLRLLEQGHPSGQPVVFLHGMLDSWQSWQRILPDLPASLHAIVPDLRGHGASDRPGRYRVADFASDVVQLIDHLGLGDVTLVGHSMGTFIAREVARKAPDRVSGLVLIGSAGRVGNPGVLQLQQSLAMIGDEVDRDFIEDFQYSTIHRPVPEHFLTAAVEASLGVPPPVWRAVLDDLARFDDRRRLGELRQASLIVWGELDAMFTASDQEDLLNGIRGSRMVSYRGVGHAPHWEVPRLVLADLLAFLSGDHERR